MSRPHVVRYLIISFYVMLVLLATIFGHYRFKSLHGFFNRDIGFYLEFASKVFDGKSAQRFQVSAFGGNAFNFNGIDGARSLHQQIHFEPIRYVSAYLYRLIQTPIALFAFFAVFYFLPILYLGRILERGGTKESMLFLLALIILYGLFPSSLFAVTFDLRSFSLLTPLVLLSFSSIFLKRPTIESILLFNTMFLIREEALIFGAAIIAYIFIENWKNPLESNKKLFQVLSISWLIWAAVIGIYFWWAAFPFTGFGSDYWMIGRKAFILLVISISAVILFLAKYRKRLRELPFEILPLLSLFLPFGIILANTLATSPLSLAKALLFNPRFSLLIALAIILIMYIYTRIKNKAPFLKIFSLITLIIISLNFILLKYSAISVFREAYRHRDDTKIILDFRKYTDKYRDYVLTDIKTHVMLYDYENIFAYRDLPTYYMTDDEQSPIPFPQSIPLLVSLIKEKIKYVIISDDSLDEVRGLLEISKVPFKLKANNGIYSVYERNATTFD